MKSVSFVYLLSLLLIVFCTFSYCAEVDSKLTDDQAIAAIISKFIKKNFKHYNDESISRSCTAFVEIYNNSKKSMTPNEYGRLVCYQLLKNAGDTQSDYYLTYEKTEFKNHAIKSLNNYPGNEKCEELTQLFRSRYKIVYQSLLKMITNCPIIYLDRNINKETIERMNSLTGVYFITESSEKLVSFDKYLSRKNTIYMLDNTMCKTFCLRSVDCISDTKNPFRATDYIKVMSNDKDFFAKLKKCLDRFNLKPIYVDDFFQYSKFVDDLFWYCTVDKNAVCTKIEYSEIDKAIHTLLSPESQKNKSDEVTKTYIPIQDIKLDQCRFDLFPLKDSDVFQKGTEKGTEKGTGIN